VKSLTSDTFSGVVSVMHSIPEDSTFLLNKFQGLIEKGWNITIVCWDNMKEVKDGISQTSPILDMRRRVKVARPIHPRWRAAILFPFVLFRCILGNPLGTAHYFFKGWKRFGAKVISRLYLDAEIICANPDLLHFEFGTLAVGRMHLGDLLGCKMVVSFRGYDLNYVGLETSNYYQEVWEKAGVLHLLGEDLWSRAQQRGCPSDKQHVLIPPAIDTSFFDPEERSYAVIVGTQERPMRILSVGRFVWKKGYEYALLAMRMLLDKGVYFEYHIIGDGEFIEAVAFTKHQLGLDHCAELLGEKSSQEVKSQMQWADVFLHTSVSEGFCNAVLEAQAMRLPVVCTDADGLRENVVDGITGFVVPRRGPKALAEKLALLAGDPSLRERMGIAGRKRVSEKFQISAQIEAFEKLYISLLN
jgi:colanic acid/amylovoran biosynthesis glycosyltransferase